MIINVDGKSDFEARFIGNPFYVLPAATPKYVVCHTPSPNRLIASWAALVPEFPAANHVAIISTAMWERIKQIRIGQSIAGRDGALISFVAKLDMLTVLSHDTSAWPFWSYKTDERKVVLGYLNSDPVAWTAKQTPQAAPPCPDCKGTGRLTLFTSVKPCPKCTSKLSDFSIRQDVTQLP